MNHPVRTRNVHQIECVRANGSTRWRETIDPNLIPTDGLNELLDATFVTGNVSPAWYVGLVDGAQEPIYAAADVMGDHRGWIENTAYSELTRQAFVPGSIADGSIDNSASRAVFTVSSDGTVAGVFICSDSVKGGTDGVLYGEGTFDAGARPVEIGDSIRTTTTLSVAD